MTLKCQLLILIQYSDYSTKSEDSFSISYITMSNAFDIDDIQKIIIYFEIDFPNERSKKAYNTLFPLATDENNQFEGNVYN